MSDQEAFRFGICRPFEKELIRTDGRRIRVLVTVLGIRDYARYKIDGGLQRPATQSAPQERVVVGDSQALSSCGTFYGLVYSEVGKPVPGALVYLVKKVDDAVLWTGKTDFLGRYCSPTVSIGSYGLAVLAAGYQPFEQLASVEARTPLRLDIKLSLRTSVEPAKTIY